MARDHRRLAAIVSADVAGYSRLMGLDDSATLAELKAHRRELIDIKKDIWRSEPLEASFGLNSVGLFAKFVPPTVANGKVFVATYGDHETPPGPIRYWQQNVPPPGSIPKNFYVAVYGLRP